MTNELLYRLLSFPLYSKWGRAFTAEEQQELVRLCAKGNRELLNIQREILKR